MLTHRLATVADLPGLEALAVVAIDRLQAPYLRPEQVAASHAIMGIDTRLVDDGTYFVVEDDGALAGCGGWSRRATLFGGDHTSGRDDALLDPERDPARVRAMYTHPDHVRRGVGRLVLTLCEQAAAAEGFRRLELMATIAGEPLYSAFGFRAVEHLDDTSTGTPIPLVKMAKPIDDALIGATRPTHLFVYGTLQPGHLRWPYLAPFAIDHRPAATPGQLYDSGCGWPIAVFGDVDTVVPGTIVELDAARLDGALRMLDEVEETATDVLRRIVVTTEDGARAWAYGGRASTGEMTPIDRWHGIDER
jgi:gamma-glutamylcyclotransferase (GGCT)/AIG2-like uncharacterized protein YtfP/GNAT superfamily N-acetyltransferase